MKLWEVPRKTWVKVITPDEEFEPVIFFDHIDGMYSYCLNENGDVIHISAWAKVEITEEPTKEN